MVKCRRRSYRLHLRCSLITNSYASEIMPIRFRMDSLHSITIRYTLCTLRSHIASAINGSPILSHHPGTSNCEQKIVDAFLYRASAISRRSRASVSFSEYSSHSSSISSEGFLYCWITLRNVQLPLAMASSVSSSGRRIYFTV